jgi:hypothetical protein
MFSGGGSGHLSMFLDPARIVLDDENAVEEAIEIADRLHLGRLVATGIRRSCEIIGVPGRGARVPAHASRRHARWRDMVALWAFDSPERRVVREQVSLLGGLTPRQAARWLAAWIKPADEYQGASLARRFASRVRSRSSTP